MSESQAFNKLHQGVQRWVWDQQWTILRDIQEEAIDPILNADTDLIISASTAAGKTEAAFLPACSQIATLSPESIGILYISPLKALINDQYRRLQGLCERIKIPVTPWHGDVLHSIKDKQRKAPRGILLITPESLESMLLNRPGWSLHAFSGLNYIIVDEFHVFIGTERGCQLQSLMHRLEFLLERTIPRIALSATLGNMAEVAVSLRLDSKLPCKLIESNASQADLKIQMRGYITPAVPDKEQPLVMDQVIDDLFKILRGKSHLVFSNSRSRTEYIAANLSDRCRQQGVPNEFFPHHGSLAKEIREDLESRLQRDNVPTTAICTTTLELGIDIGSVDSIAQITAPHSVASLRQRLGRSGRRGEAAVLRLFVLEDEITSKSHLIDRLRLQTIQCVAMINLLLKKWYEPAPPDQYHFSTLVQQTLAVIGQYGGVLAQQLWTLLCKQGSFSQIDQRLYSQFLKSLGEHDLISQTHDGQIILGYKGEKLVQHFTFYTAFNTPEEYCLEFNGRPLGTIPIEKPLVPKQQLIFAGKRWKVLNVDAEKKRITLERASGGRPPSFSGCGQMVHDIVRQEMLQIYRSGQYPIYLDETAKSIFAEGIECFRALHLGNNSLLQIGRTVHILPWLGDRTTNTLAMLLRLNGLSADSYGGIIDVSNSSIDIVKNTVKSVFASPKPTATELAHYVLDTLVEKHDIFLPQDLREIGYGARFFDVDGAWKFLSTLL